MRRCAVSIALLLAFLAFAGDPSHEIFREIDGTLRELSEISGLQARKRTAYDLITREKVNEFLKQRIKEVAKPEELRAEELTLKKFGLVPPDFDLAKTTVDVLTEQAAAFYDYNKKKLYVTDWTASSTRQAALVHELAHALADQNFNLERYIHQARKSDDGSMARMAVMEGQASWLMSEVLARKMGQSLLNSPRLAEMMSRASETGGEFPVFEGAPLYIRETLIFPYTKGMLFQQALVEKMGKAAFAEVFRRPPASTQQILHPETYSSALRPTAPSLPSPPRMQGYKRLIAGSVGELDHAILLRQYAGEEESQSLSPHWRGGRYELLEHRDRRRTVLLYASDWDESASARRFFTLYREVLRKKWKRIEVSSEGPDTLAGVGDDGHFLVRRRGASVSSMEGLESPPAVN